MTTPTYTLLQSGSSYGIAVEADGKCIRVESITENIEDAGQILRLLAENTVYPDNVLEILDDLLGVQFW